MGLKMENISEENQGFDVKEIVQLLKRHWKFLVFSLIFCVGLAFVYIRYSSERYSSHAKIFIKDSSSDFSPSDLRLNGVQLLNGDNGAESEAEILKSRMLIEVVVKKLALNTEIYRYSGRAGTKKVEIYDGSPFTVVALNGDSLFQKTKLKFKVNMLDRSTFVVQSEKTGKQKVTSNVPFIIDGEKLKLVSTESYRDVYTTSDFEVIIDPLEEVVTRVRNSLKVNTDKGSIGILEVVFEGGNIRKNNAIINELIFEHQEAAIREKNRIAENTRDFLTNRISLIEDKLRGIEEKGRTLKSDQGIVSVEGEITTILLQEKELEAELQVLLVNLELATQMENYVANNSDNKQLIPVNLGFENQSLASTINEYNTLILKRNGLLDGSSSENPIVKKIENDLKILNANLSMSLNSFMNSQRSQIKKIESKLSVFSGEKSNIPGYEMRYRDVMREQQISESIYLLLLQKKEENEIILASTQGNIRVIDYAYSNGLPVSPKKKVAYLIAFILGLLIPSALIFLRHLFDNRFKGIADMDRLGLPYIGEIPNSKDDDVFLAKNPRSHTAEAFRLIRSNINFMLDPSKKSNVIMVTSTISGEGKTYVSLKLAASLANTWKKVVVVGMDLRAPKLMEYADLSSSPMGVSNYLVKQEIELKDIMVDVPENELIKIIPSGTIPPNPNEILLRPRVNELFEQLRNEFDYIIVDTSPVGLVADTFSIAHHADLMLYVSRANYIDKRKLAIPQKLYQTKKFKSVIWLVNGIDLKDNEFGYGYGYGDDHQQEEKIGFLKRVKNRFKSA